jgi:exopolyphosphatase/guanosine-5'-triphosphate,3'-diphosphate pyrophosphatase
VPALGAALASGVWTRPADPGVRIEPVVVGIVDIGSNTARLLVASVDEHGVEQLARDRRYLRLGDDVHAFGRIGARKLEEAGDVADRFARRARKNGAERLETIVTAPGRQAANGDELVRMLAESTHAPVLQLTGEDEGRLAWEGAVARMEEVPEVVAVVDLGGGSFEVAVGTPTLGPAWIRSVDGGALRVTRELLGGDPPSPKKVARARDTIRELVSDLDPPRPDAALVVGGTARAIGRIAGRRYGIEELEGLAETLSQTPAEKVTEPHGITAERAHTLLGGTLVLAELARRLGTELRVGRGGLREGAALSLAGRAAAVA